jgi:hypothetical protein
MPKVVHRRVTARAQRTSGNHGLCGLFTQQFRLAPRRENLMLGRLLIFVVAD